MEIGEGNSHEEALLRLFFKLYIKGQNAHCLFTIFLLSEAYGGIWVGNTKKRRTFVKHGLHMSNACLEFCTRQNIQPCHYHTLPVRRTEGLLCRYDII